MANKLTSKETLTIRLGSDLQAPISNTFTDLSGMDLLLQDIQLLLLTNPGERPFRPSFGSGLKSIIWGNISTADSNGSAAIKNALDLYEPRIAVLNVTSQTNENSGLIIFNIQFVVNSTDQKVNLVFPLRMSTDLSFA
jgi:uncharacterized protein